MRIVKCKPNGCQMERGVCSFERLMAVAPGVEPKSDLLKITLETDSQLIV